MAKIKHHNFLDTVNDVFTDAMEEGILHLYAEGENFSGRKIRISGSDMFHFGTTGYLGLEQDPRLKKAAISAIESYGTQFPLSKSYISNPLYRDLEECITQMYKTPIIITKNSTLGHMGAIPSAVDDKDAIILDHQVHWSVQNAAKLLKTRSVPIDMIRHNNLEMLEDKLKKYAQTRRLVWYMADGIYSMYGDLAPVEDLMALSVKYPQLRLYFDDVHGMSWVGKHGTGYVMNILRDLPENVLLFGTLSKTFGASGALLACSDKKLYKKIKTFGGPLTFSAQLEPASVAAATASAKIHLSSEIYTLQNELEERIGYFNDLLEQTGLPLIDKNQSPVFYIGTGMPKTGYNFVNRLMSEGFFVNLGLFPAVPVKNTGVRITISRHNQKEEIRELVNAMEYHYPRALEETYTNMDRILHAFKLQEGKTKMETMEKGLHIQMETSIKSIDKQQWNAMLGRQNCYDWDGLCFLETSLTDNTLKEDNWIFRYLIITDEKKNPILATFFSVALWKDDMFAKEDVSQGIEQKRKGDPYHLTSMVLGMGSLFTEGNHLYMDRGHPQLRQALNIMIQQLEKLEQDQNAKMLVLRDFPQVEELHSYLHGQGFIRIQMPDSCTITLDREQGIDDYIAALPSRNRRHYRKDIAPYEPLVNTQIIQSPDLELLRKIKVLYDQVRQNNLGLNTFGFPDKLFQEMAKHPNWEFITIYPKAYPDKLIGVMLCYKNLGHTYVPAFVGMDYGHLKAFNTYRQLLFQTIKRALVLEMTRIDMGMTASFEKRKLGATVTEKFAYLQSSDNYVLELMGMLEGHKA